MKWTRQAPGSYVAFASTTMTKEGTTKTVPVRIEVIKNPDWDPKAEQWYTNIVALFPDRAIGSEQTLVDGARGDSIHFTMSEAKKAAEANVKTGFTLYRGSGISAWVPAA